MIKYVLSLFVLFYCQFPLFSQNVGIGTATPAEKLDVNGNINLTGTIKANGDGGAANQVLMKNSGNVLTWGDLCDYKNAITFTTVGSGTWTVPAGVTRIRVEVWGGGGGGSGNGSGAGGGYATGIFTVSGGSVSYTVGSGGTGGSPGTNGGLSTASYGGLFVTASGGEGDNSASTFTVAAGGGFSGNAAAGYYGAVGEAGSQNKFEGYQLNATTWRESQTGGKGGDGGNTLNTGGKGAYLLRDGVSSSVIYGYFGGNGRMPGGGGGSTGTWGGSLQNGAQGMVIIHY